MMLARSAARRLRIRFDQHGANLGRPSQESNQIKMDGAVKRLCALQNFSSLSKEGSTRRTQP